MTPNGMVGFSVWIEFIWTFESAAIHETDRWASDDLINVEKRGCYISAGPDKTFIYYFHTSALLCTSDSYLLNKHTVMRVAAPPHCDTADRVVGARAEGVLQNGTEGNTSIVISVLTKKVKKNRIGGRKTARMKAASGPHQLHTLKIREEQCAF